MGEGPEVCYRGIHFRWEAYHFLGWDHEVLERVDWRSFGANLFDSNASTSFLSHDSIFLSLFWFVVMDVVVVFNKYSQLALFLNSQLLLVLVSLFVVKKIMSVCCCFSSACHLSSLFEDVVFL